MKDPLAGNYQTHTDISRTDSQIFIESENRHAPAAFPVAPSSVHGAPPGNSLQFLFMIRLLIKFAPVTWLIRLYRFYTGYPVSFTEIDPEI